MSIANEPGHAIDPRTSAQVGSRIRAVRPRHLAPRARSIVAAMLVALLLMVIWVFVTGPRYTSTASILLSSLGPASTGDQADRVDLNTEAEIAVSEPILEQAGSMVGASYEDLSQAVTATPITNTRILQLSLDAPSAAAATSRLSAVITVYQDRRRSESIQELQAYRASVAQRLSSLQPTGALSDIQSRSTLDAQRSQALAELAVAEKAVRTEDGGLSIVDPPRPPSFAAAWARIGLTVVLAVVVAGVLATFAYALVAMFSRNYRNLTEFRDFCRLPLLSCCDGPSTVESTSVDPDVTMTIYRMLAVRKPVRLILAYPGDTADVALTVAHQIARRIGASGYTVLIVTSRGGSGDESAGGTGLADVVTHRCSMPDVVVPPSNTGPINVWRIGPGRCPTDDGEMSAFTSHAVVRFLREQSGRWDTTIMVSSVENAALIAERGSALIVCGDVTAFDADRVYRWVDAFGDAGVSLAGAVVRGGR